ncbi:MAG: hypothetical protein NUV46_03910 [Nanoarchaeota archaeon]|nr:hypothetical protein [Nanoarchaeota archaeon]
MKITGNYMGDVIEEVAPLVKEISGLKTNLEKSVIKIRWFNEKSNYASYNPFEDVFKFNKNLFLNEEGLKLIVGHELMHNAQYKSKEKLLIKQIKYFLKSDELEEINPLNALTEGDATLIEKNLQEKFFKGAKRTLFKRRLPFTNSFANSSEVPYTDKFRSPNYVKWANILKNEFGGDRDKINSLYEKDYNQLKEIFGEKK